MNNKEYDNMLIKTFMKNFQDNFKFYPVDYSTNIDYLELVVNKIWETANKNEMMSFLLAKRCMDMLSTKNNEEIFMSIVEYLKNIYNINK